MTRQEASALFAEIAAELKLPANWVLRFDKSKRRFGACKRRRNASLEEGGVISLSEPIVALNEPGEVGKTIRHEIAHAFAGHAAGHGPLWQAWDVKCGGDGRRCYDGDDVEVPPAPLVAKCPKCGKEFEAHREPRRPSWCRCGAAYAGAKRFDPAMALSFAPRPGTVLEPKIVAKDPQVLKVLQLRQLGWGYVKIDAHFGIHGKKGWWSWKICKTFSTQ